MFCSRLLSKNDCICNLHANMQCSRARCTVKDVHNCTRIKIRCGRHMHSSVVVFSLLFFWTVWSLAWGGMRTSRIKLSVSDMKMHKSQKFNHKVCMHRHKAHRHTGAPHTHTYFSFLLLVSGCAFFILHFQMLYCVCAVAVSNESKIACIRSTRNTHTHAHTTSHRTRI